MTENENLFPLEFVRECFYVDDDVVYWAKRPAHHFGRPADHATFIKKSAHRPAGRGDPKGYLTIKLRVSGRALQLQAHRVIWALHYGKWPEHTIDHINRNRSDNRIANMRDITLSDNLKNTLRATNLPRGVELFRGKPRVRISVAGTPLYFGTFNSIEEAGAASERLSKRLIEFAKSLAEPSASVPLLGGER